MTGQPDRPVMQVMTAHLLEDCPAPAACWYGPHRRGERLPDDCRSEQGVLVGLIDGMIAQARVIARSLRDGLLPGAALSDALADLAGDEDVAFLIGREVAR